MVELSRDGSSIAHYPTSEEIAEEWDNTAAYFALYDEAEKFAHRVLDKWGYPGVQPVPVKERLPEVKDLHPTEGWAWFCTLKGEWVDRLPPDSDAFALSAERYFPYTHWLPYHAIPYIRPQR